MLTVAMTMSPIRVTVSLDSFKGTIDAVAASRAVAAGWREARPKDRVTVLPMADGGEGTAAAVRSVSPGAKLQALTVTGPDGQVAHTAWLLLPDGTAIVETATTCGYTMNRRSSAVEATSAGLGEALRAAVRHPDTRQILIALGGSATTDGGAGALWALGAKFTDGRVDLSALVPPPPGGVRCLTDVTAPLLGDLGAARQFAPQKGADPAEVDLLEARLARWAELLGGNPYLPGAGAAGGIGYGLATAWGAELQDGAAHVADLIGLSDQLRRADVVITGEGRFDQQSMQGKVVGHVIGAALANHCRPLLICGSAAPDAVTRVGDTNVVELATLAGSSRNAMAEPEQWVAAAGRLLAKRL